MLRSSSVTLPGVFLWCLLGHTLLCHHAQHFLTHTHTSVLLSCLCVSAVLRAERWTDPALILCCLTCLWACVLGLLVSHVTANQKAGRVCVCMCVFKPLISDILPSFVWTVKFFALLHVALHIKTVSYSNLFFSVLFCSHKILVEIFGVSGNSVIPRAALSGSVYTGTKLSSLFVLFYLSWLHKQGEIWSLPLLLM